MASAMDSDPSSPSTSERAPPAPGEPTPPGAEVVRLVAEHHQAVYRMAWRLTGSVPDAEDLTQQVFLAVHARPEQLAQVIHPRAWLLTILRNAYLKSLRKKVPVPASALEVDVDDLPAETADDPAVDTERLQAALNELPAEFKLVLLLFYFEDCTYQEIAHRLEIPLGTVMSRLSRAKGHLRARLNGRALERSRG